jgi:NTP pyrophosphatase (non-canonical NTP hydrolase)
MEKEMATQQEFEQHVKGFSQSEHLNNHELILNFALGLAGETGEFIDVLKKHLFNGDELDRTKLIKEAGDICFYVIALQQQLDIEPRSFLISKNSRYSLARNLLKLHSGCGSVGQRIDDCFECLCLDDGEPSLPHFKDRVVQEISFFSRKLSQIFSQLDISYEEIFDANITKLRERHGGTKFDREAQRISKGKE